MVKVYMAGAIGNADPVQCFRNIENGVDWSAQVLSLGCVSVYSPFIDHAMVARSTLDMAAVYAHSIEWLKACDCVFLVPGWENSKGTAHELEIAKECGMPVFTSLMEVYEYAKG